MCEKELMDNDCYCCKDFYICYEANELSEESDEEMDKLFFDLNDEKDDYEKF